MIVGDSPLLDNRGDHPDNHQVDESVEMLLNAKSTTEGALMKRCSTASKKRLLNKSKNDDRLKSESKSFLRAGRNRMEHETDGRCTRLVLRAADERWTKELKHI